MINFFLIKIEDKKNIFLYVTKNKGEIMQKYFKKKKENKMKNNERYKQVSFKHIKMKIEISNYK